MIITDYYKFEHLINSAKTRLDCVASTGSYPALESLRRKNKLWIYYGGTDHIKGNRKRKADKAITNGKNISSVYFGDIEGSFAYGDFKGTNDAILFVVTEIDSSTVMELFICRGKKNNQTGLCNRLEDGDLDHEIKHWRGKAHKEGIAQLDAV